MKEEFSELKKLIEKEQKIIGELNYLFIDLEGSKNQRERQMISAQINSLVKDLKETNDSIPLILDEISLVKPLPVGENITKQDGDDTQKAREKIPAKKEMIGNIATKNISDGIRLSDVEKETLKRIKRREIKIKVEEIKKPSKYVELANRFFFDFSSSLVKKKTFPELESDLPKAGFKLTPSSYISVILFTTVISAIAGFFIFLFFLFFKIDFSTTIISPVKEDIGLRFLKVFWILFLMPVATFLASYLYPFMERKSIESQINQELTFATIHMSAISGSMIEPSKIFSIIIATKEYPFLRRELIRLINRINVYGYDFVTALRDSAVKSPSERLSDLFNGLAITITSGGSLSDFFSKRAETMLFEYRLEREKYTKLAETFMDIYISVVIAAPMILMLLLIMIKIGGLGIPISASMITLMMVLGVAAINIFFILFLHLKQPND